MGLLVLVMWACRAPLSLLLAMLPHLEQHGTSFSNAYRAYPDLESVTGLRALGEVVGVTIVLGLLIAAGLSQLDAVVLRALTVNAVSFTEPRGRTPHPELIGSPPGIEEGLV